MSDTTDNSAYIDALNALPARRRVFVQAYLDTLNATEAARKAKYAKASEEGYRLLRNAQVAEAVRLGLAELTISREEVLARLTAQATASLGDFFTLPAETAAPDSEDAAKTHIWKLDLVRAKRLGKLGLIKKLRWGEFGPEIELHDSQTALITLARHYGLLVERQEISGPGGGPVRITDLIIARPDPSAPDEEPA